MAREYVVLIHHDSESGMYLVEVPDLPGIVTEAATPEGAREMAAEAIPLHLEGLSAEGLLTPEPGYTTHVVAVA